MKKNSKKLIALLSVCCMATAAAALAGCDKETTTDKSAYEIAKAQGWFTGTEAEFNAMMHVHSYDGEIVVVTAPTGAAEGLGYKVCAADGQKEYVVLPKIAGVIPSNPIELTVGESKTISINDYDSDTYGADKYSGEKGVMYFKTKVSKTGYVSLPTTAPEGVDVEYTFYYADTYAEDDVRFSRNVWVDETEEGATADVYVKVKFISTETDENGDLLPLPATVDISAKVVSFNDATNPGTIKHTVKLSQGTAQELVVINSGGSEEWLNSEEGGNYVAFGGGDTATVWLQPGNYTFAIEGLADGYCIADESQFIVTCPDDGSKDADAEYTITIGKSYDYQFTVTDQNDAPIADATVSVANADGDVVEFGTTDAEGKVTLWLNETLDEEGKFVFNYTVSAEDLGFAKGAPAAIALDLANDNKAVTMKANALSVATWEVGTGYDVFTEVDYSYSTVTVDGAAAGDYILTVFSTTGNDWMPADAYTVTVNGVSQVIGGDFDLIATSLEAKVALVEGANTVAVTTSGLPNQYDLQVKLEKMAPAPDVKTIGLDSKTAVELSYQYEFVAPKDGKYFVAFESSYWYDTMVYKTYEDATANEEYFGFSDKYWLDGAAIDAGDVAPQTELISLQEGEKLTFCIVEYPGAGITASATVQAAPSVMTLNQAMTMEKGVAYSFTATKTGTYYFTSNCALGSFNKYVRLTMTKDYLWAGQYLFYSVEQEIGAIEVTEGETYTIYAGVLVGSDVTVTVWDEYPELGADNNGGDNGGDLDDGFNPDAK